MNRPPFAKIEPGLDIVHRDDVFVVVNKPSGLHSVPGIGEDKQDSIQSRVQEAFSGADGPLICHRLDLETSGLMVVALNRDAHRSLSKQFMNRQVGKSYDAIVEGTVDVDEGAVDLPVIVDWPNRPRQHVNYERGKPARTLFRVTNRDSDRNVTRVQFRPITGRSHQLRVHAATPRTLPEPPPIEKLVKPDGPLNLPGGIGHPILGDSLYGDPTRAPRLMLHASMLAFWMPGEDQTWLKFDSPPPF